MLSLGWCEISIIFIIVIVIIGPNEIPNLLKQFGTITKKMKSLSRDFNTSINNIVKETEIEKVQKQINKATKFDLEKEIIDKSNLKSEFSDINKSFENLSSNKNEKEVKDEKDIKKIKDKEK